MTDHDDERREVPRFDWMSDEEYESQRRAVLASRKLAEMHKVVMQLHGDAVPSDRTPEDRAKMVEMVRGWLRSMKATGDLEAGGLEDNIAASLGRWLVADHPERAARIAPKSRFWFRAVSSALADLVIRSEATPPALQEFHAGILRQSVTEPPAGRARPANLGLQLAIHTLVDAVGKFGWHIAYPGNANTASEIVAEALGAEGLASIEPDRVRKIYYDGQDGILARHLEKLRREGSLGESLEAPEGWWGEK